MENNGKVMKSQSLKHYDSIICTIHRPWSSLQTGPFAGRRPEPSGNEDCYKVHCTLIFQFCPNSKPGKTLPNSFWRSPAILPKKKTSIHLLKFRINEHKLSGVIPSLKVKKLVMHSTSHSRIKKNTEPNTWLPGDPLWLNWSPNIACLHQSHSSMKKSKHF